MTMMTWHLLTPFSNLALKNRKNPREIGLFVANQKAWESHEETERGFELEGSF